MIVNAGVDLTIFGKRLYLSLGFNLKDPAGSLRVGADKSTNWYKDKMNQKSATGTGKNYYDNPNPFVDFVISGEPLVGDVKKANTISLFTYISRQPFQFSSKSKEFCIRFTVDLLG